MFKRNSTIKIKNCKCSNDCKSLPTLGCSGYNIKHLPAELKEKYFEKYRKGAIQKRNKSVKSNLSRKLHKLTDEEKMEKLEMQNWFDYVGRKIALEPFCWECKLLGKSTFIPEIYYRHSSAHTMPKRKEHGFPSIKTHPDNYLILADTCGHHSLYDRSWDDASKMKVWPIALEKIKKMLPFIAASEMKNLPPIIRQQLDL